jgi:twitching motility two-component system response regulator PilH
MATGVLVVDDEDDIRMIMRVVLQDAGYAVFEAPEGRSALVQLAYSPQAMVVLLDLKMPGMNGFAVLRALAKDEHLASRHAFVVATALDTRALREDEIALLTRFGIRRIDKPFDLDDLFAAVRAAEQRLVLRSTLARHTP